MANSFTKKPIHWSREMTTKLINLYEQYPCLYLSQSIEYHSRKLKTTAIQEIATELNKSKLSNDTVTTEDIQRKIHGIRTQYVAEKNKIKKNQTSEPYCPKLWCYEMLQFLNDSSGALSHGEISPATTVPNIVKNDLENSDEIPANSDSEDFFFEEDVKDFENVVLPPQSHSISSDSRDNYTESLHTDTQDGSRTDYKTEFAGNNKKRKTISMVDLKNVSVQTCDNSAMSSSSDEINANTLFAKLLAMEMSAIDNDDILDTLKQDILLATYKAKKQCRELRKNGMNM